MPPAVRSGPLALGALVWLALAVAVGAAGVLERLAPPWPQLIVLALTVGLISAGVGLPALRAWALRVDVRTLVALHLSRFVGIYFLALFRRGELPFAFAVPGGWGDIIVATLALALLPLGPPLPGVRRFLYTAWNLFGLVDIVYVVATAARLGIADPPSMSALLRLPLSLLPTFLVPLIIASHLLIAVRLARTRG